MTTIGLGGPARLFIECRSLDELRAALDEARRRQLPLQVLGGGSNLIFPDRGFDGIVMRVALRGIEWTDEGAFVSARVRAGEWWDEFVRQTVERGLAGVECLSGIPGSAGAVPIQNVGAYGQEVTGTITEVRALNRTTGEERAFSNAECEFGYRMSRFKEREKDQWIVTEVVFRLLKHRRAPGAVYPELQRHLEAQAALQSAGAAAEGASQGFRLNTDGTLPEAFASAAEARAALSFIRASVIALRKKKSMVIDPADPDTRSVGSFFMNPVVTQEEFARISGRWNEAHPGIPMPSFASGANTKIPAAWLIERAGFPKGYRKGGVGISSHHTLALVNYGGTTDELFALAGEIQRGVEAAFGIRLEREAIAAG